MGFGTGSFHEQVCLWTFLRLTTNELKPADDYYDDTVDDKAYTDMEIGMWKNT